ncbi:MAG: transposase, partial [Myxococcota bacterium]
MDPFTGLTVGVDLADRASAICVIGRDGDVVLRETIPTNADVIRAWFSRGQYDRVVIEACTNASWVGWTLEECGQRVLVADPRSIGLIHKKSRKNDRRDPGRLFDVVRVPGRRQRLQHGSLLDEPFPAGRDRLAQHVMHERLVG